MSNSICTSNVTSGFIDLATFDELEKYMYGGPDATAYFVRETRKSTWFTQVPVVLSRASGSPGFGQEWSVSISRAGDYLLQSWLRCTIGSVTLTPANVSTIAVGNNTLPPSQAIRVRWTRNLMHNLIRECCITFNDLVAARFDNFHLDFWTAFTVPAGKRNGYNNMIGNVPDLTFPQTNTSITVDGKQVVVPALPQVTLNLPLPLFFTRDSGVALPTAALPYNDMRINFSFQDWEKLLIIDDLNILNSHSSTVNSTRAATISDINVAPSISACQVWANYAIVSNDERKRMACAPRDILIEQVQTAPKQTFNPSRDQQPSYDIRFSHAIKVFFFGARNNTVSSQWSNYTAGQPVPTNSTCHFTSPAMVDPILNTSLVYENTARLSNMGSDYFCLINPWYHAPHIPMETGYHMYSYSLDFICLDPMGSTNYGKLTNVSIAPQASQGAIDASKGIATLVGEPFSGAEFPQTWEFCTTAVNNNIVRISGGALGFPVL